MLPLTNNEKKLSGTKGGDSPPLKGNEKNTIFISEPGLYSLIMRSKLPEAERFQDWIYEEVLPSIRKTGKYDIEQGTIKLKVTEDIEELNECLKIVEDLNVGHNYEILLQRFIEASYGSGVLDEAKAKMKAISNTIVSIHELPFTSPLKKKLIDKMYDEFKVKDEKPKEDAYLDWIQPYE